MPRSKKVLPGRSGSLPPDAGTGTLKLNPLPGGTPAIDPLEREGRLKTLNAIGNPIENAAAELETKLTEHLGNGLAQSEAQAADLQNRLQGFLGVGLDRLEASASKIAGKLAKHENKLQGNAYQGVFSYGGRYPTIEEVITGLKTADPWTAHGLPVPGRLASSTADPGDPLPVGDFTPAGEPPFLPPPSEPPSPIPLGPPLYDPCSVYGHGAHMNEHGVCVPGFQGQWGPCIGGAWPDPVTGICPTYPQSGPPPAPPPTDNCSSFVRVRCAMPGEANTGPVGPGGSTVTMPICYTGPDSNPGEGYELATFPFYDPQSGQTFPQMVWVHTGMYLCVDKQSGTVFESQTICTGASTCTLEATAASPPPTDPPPTPPPPPDVCKPIPPVDCPPELKPPPNQPDPSIGWCKAIADWIENLKNDVDPFRDTFGMSPGEAKPSLIGGQIAATLTGSTGPVLPGLLDRAKRWAEEMNRTAANASSCQSASMVTVSAMRAVADLIQSYLHILPPQFVTFLQQAHNTICQYLIPSPTEADRAYLADAITQEEWECYHKAAGNMIDPREKIIDGDRTRPGPREIDLLYRRDQLSQEQWRSRMRAAGVMRDEDIAAYHDLNANWPDKSDLIRYMQRDVFDEDTVQLSGLDTDFEKKYTGDALQYADALGLTENHMRYAWRAHWQLPSLTMAGQMLARCRPDKVPEDAVVTEDDVLQLLKQDDWAPAWIPSMMEILKQPLTRMDVRRMYQLHNATEEQLRDYFLDLRYSKDDADALVAFFKRQREVAEAKASGLPTQRTLTNQFAKGEVTRKELTDTLAKITLTQELADAGVASAQEARQTYRRGQVIKGVKRQYVAGLIDDGDATNMLAREGVDADEITELLELWSLDLRDKGKQASGAQLCKWRSLNLISPIEQLEALIRTGWSVADAQRIVTQCQLELSEKERKAAERAAKEQAAAAEKLLRKQRQAAKESGELLPIRTRKIVVSKGAKGTTTTDTETIPVPALPGDPATVAGGL